MRCIQVSDQAAGSSIIARTVEIRMRIIFIRLLPYDGCTGAADVHADHVSTSGVTHNYLIYLLFIGIVNYGLLNGSILGVSIL